MNVLRDWINEYYLSTDGIETVRESVLAKPSVKYAVLDNFFKTDKLNTLITNHQHLPFSEEHDRRAHEDGSWLPYDGAVVFARPGVHYGHELFFAQSWHEYLAYITDAKLVFPTTTEVKLRWHKPDATGFWIHSDATIRTVVAIWYFNRNWKHTDGGLLQLWRVDEGQAPNTLLVNSPDPTQRLDFLTKHQRVRTSTPGGGFRDGQAHDMVLIDQIVPIYNRLFVCNYQENPAYHSVTPSNGRVRTGVVQWLGSKL